MTKKSLLTIISLLLLSLSAAAQSSLSIDGVTLDQLNTSTVSNGTQLNLSFVAQLDQIRVGSQDLWIFVPVLKSNQGDESLQLEPFFVAGKTRARVIERERRLGNPQDYMTPTPKSITTRRAGAQSVSYTDTLPLQEWMKDASLDLKLYVIGCAACDKSTNEIQLSSRILREPAFQVAYVVPEVEEVKVRSDKYTAIIGFRVDDTKIDPNYANNAAVLQEVNDKVVAIIKNPDLNATKLEIVGYASPEASVAYNKDLSDRRAATFVQYLGARHAISPRDLSSRGYGEDWGMAEELLSHPMPGISQSAREQVLEIIRTTPDLDARDAKIRAIDGGATYATLVAQVWPKIRRTEYTISYTVRPFDVEEAKKILKTNPKLLSLNEMYLVARSYGADREEYREVFDIASRLYPNEPTLLVNGAAADLEQKSYARALKTLPQLSDTPEALNNLGVAHALAGDYDSARAAFEQARQMGSKEAEHNLSEL
ncbi:MAG: OmpA family protein [Porphyromonas sp.]|nr:OmpA family protein [Porphyromonas sp.]